MVHRDKLISQVHAKFKQQFGNEPKNVTLTPGRINIIGEHTDYNDGLAMPTAINRWICSAVCRSHNELSTIYSLNYSKSVVINPNTSETFNEIWEQLAATAIHIITTKFDVKIGVNMAVGGNIPIGFGLSSSSAFIISITQTFCCLLSIQIEDRELAILCQKIENRALGTAGGRLDQYGIILSKKDHFIVVDFQDDSIEYIPATLNECSWIVVNSQVQRELSKSAYPQRVNECKEGLNILIKKCNISSFRDIDQSMLEILKNESIHLYNRLYHLVNENKRVCDMKNHSYHC